MQFCQKIQKMDIHDIEHKKDNDLVKFIQEKLNIPSVETLSGAEINAIVEAIKQRPDNPIIFGDPLEEYIAHRNE